jgi:hypothetical protein
VLALIIKQFFNVTGILLLLTLRLKVLLSLIDVLEMTSHIVVDLHVFVIHRQLSETVIRLHFWRQLSDVHHLLALWAEILLNFLIAFLQ